MVASLEVDTNPNFTQKISELIIESSTKQPVYLTKVEVNGGEQFSNNFFEKLLAPVLKNGDYTLDDLIAKIGDSHKKLKRTEVFEDVEVSLEPDNYALIPSKIKSYNAEKSIPTKAIFKLKPRNLNINESFFNFNNEEYLNLRLKHFNKNFNQNAESVTVGVDYNPYKPFDHLIANCRLVSSLKNPSFKFLLDFNYGQENNEIWQGTKQEILGGKIGIVFSHLKNLYAFTGFELLKRNLHNLEDSNSDDLKFFNGEFLKTAIVNQVNYTNYQYLNEATRNFPIGGYQLSLDSQLSSNQEQLNAANRGEFIKTDFGVNFYQSLFNNFFTTKLQANVGGIYSFNTKFPIHPSDKFYLGGHNSFPGFTKNSVELTGGDQYYKVQGTLYSKIPSFFYTPSKNPQEEHPLRIYGTGIIGNIVNSSSNKTILDDENGVVSYGFGLRYFNNWANFDIGYYTSRRFGGEDSNTSGIKDGLQFSVSIGGSNRN
ncbi:hypothetical protein Cantr_00939 [Candida viswanathii]|uniref:Bacterial surface antigen (D15) domain-containing protein n=1 Tax=Candida viswanathii TaxID=5486 RepID=A0A367YGG2_9ASCO|nr:hypothetical protein Cantr_00939 [Candida viswanathii]